MKKLLLALLIVIFSMQSYSQTEDNDKKGKLNLGIEFHKIKDTDMTIIGFHVGVITKKGLHVGLLSNSFREDLKIQGHAMTIKQFTIGGEINFDAKYVSLGSGFVTTITSSKSNFNSIDTKDYTIGIPLNVRLYAGVLGVLMRYIYYPSSNNGTLFFGGTFRF